MNHVALEQAHAEHEQSMRDDIADLCAKMYNDVSMNYSAQKTARALKEKQIVVDQQAAKDIEKSIQLQNEQSKNKKQSQCQYLEFYQKLLTISGRLNYLARAGYEIADSLTTARVVEQKGVEVICN